MTSPRKETQELGEKGPLHLGTLVGVCLFFSLVERITLLGDPPLRDPSGNPIQGPPLREPIKGTFRETLSGAKPFAWVVVASPPEQGN